METITTRQSRAPSLEETGIAMVFLPPIVGRAPTLAPRARQKSPTPGQQALFSLLRRRHDRYLAHGIRRHAQTESLECERSGFPKARGDGPHSAAAGRDCRMGSNVPNLLSNLECSDLAEHVVYRAKVRLRRRQKGRINSLKAINNEDPCMKAGQMNLQSWSFVNSFDNHHRVLLGAKSKSASSVQVNASSSDARCYRSPYLLGTKVQARVILDRDLSSSPFQIRKRPVDTYTSTQTTKNRQKLDIASAAVEPGAKQRVVYLSEQHSDTPSTTGVPNAPPATPSGAYFGSFKYIPSLHDAKSQRMLKIRLQEISAKLKEKVLQETQEAKGEEERKQREAITKLRAQQRAEIYALNKIMTEFEEQTFQAFCSAKV